MDLLRKDGEKNGEELMMILLKVFALLLLLLGVACLGLMLWLIDHEPDPADLDGEYVESLRRKREI